MIEQNACKYHVKTRARDFTNLLAKSGGSELLSSKMPVNTMGKQGLGISQICWQNLAVIEENACKYHVKTRARDYTNLLAKSGGSEL